jgi:hypothetical protein
VNIKERGLQLNMFADLFKEINVVALFFECFFAVFVAFLPVLIPCGTWLGIKFVVKHAKRM